MKNVLFLLVYILGLIYLAAPSSPLPQLDQATISNEEGDTWQNPDQRGYYTNLTRSEVLSQVQNKFKISLAGIVFPSYRLNYRPEEAGTLVRDQLKSNYLEEIVYPFHSSVFVNGWEPKLAPKRGKNDITDDNLAIYGVPYEAKVTLRPITSLPLHRVLIWTSVFPCSYLVYLSFKKTII